MEALVPTEVQESATKKANGSRIVYVAALSISVMSKFSYFVFAKIAESEHVQSAARRWNEKKAAVQQDSRLQRVAGIVVPYAEACFSVLGNVARKSATFFTLVGKPSCVGST